MLDNIKDQPVHGETLYLIGLLLPIIAKVEAEDRLSPDQQLAFERLTARVEKYS